jgi:beta-xylosidase
LDHKLLACCLGALLLTVLARGRTEPGPVAWLNDQRLSPARQTATALGAAVQEPESRTSAVTLGSIRLRDPFILPVPEQRKYYLFGTGWTLPNGPGFMVYHSSDLEAFAGPTAAFRRPDDFWADHHFWAPEVHRYQGRYYMFASFKARDACRGTQILVSDAPTGPYRPHSRGPVTPREWECLDGTLHIDKAKHPWIVFCHEWVQVGDGEICALPLSDDLAKARGTPSLLFRASEAPWVVESGDRPRGRVTDGPFVHRTTDGTLLMLWSSFGRDGYALAVARSESGTLRGPWNHDPKPLYTNDGGHGMLFRTFDGTLMLLLHQPNRAPGERPRLFVMEERGGRLRILQSFKPRTP